MLKIFSIFLLITLHGAIVLCQETDASDQYSEVSYDLMADRIKCIEKEVPLAFNDRVKSFVDYFTIRDRAHTKSVIAKEELFFPLFETVLAEYEMPDELKYLSVIESGLRVNAMSRVGAAGLWQFMPATGKQYGLHQTWYIDERMNPEQATRAACRYLKSLYGMFNSWELALAAYNAGPGNVRKAIRRSGYKKSFWEVYKYLPRETRSYVPQYVAMIYTLNYREEHNFDENEIELHYAMEYDTILVSDYLHLETLANQLNVCVDDLITLNPQIIRGAIPDGVKAYALKVPVDKHAYIQENRSVLMDSANKVGKKELAYLARSSPGSTYGRTKQIYRVRSGDVLGLIAQRYHVKLSDLKKWNELSGNMIRVGQSIKIWTLPHYSSKTKDNYIVKTKPVESKFAPIVGGKYHTVKTGESLWLIAELYENVSIDKIKKLNKLTSSRLQPGQKLLINM